MNAIAAGRSSRRCRPRTTRNGRILAGISQSLLRASRQFAWAFMPTQSIGRSPARTIPPEHAPMRGAQAPQKEGCTLSGEKFAIAADAPTASRIHGSNGEPDRRGKRSPLGMPPMEGEHGRPPIGGVHPFGGDEAHITSGTRQLRPEIQRRTSSARHAVIPAESRIGAGNSPALTRRQRVDLENGTNRRSNRWRTKPV